MNQVGKNQTAMTLEPIAMVKNDVKEMGRRDWDKVVSQLIVRPDFEDALEGLKEFSHLIVLFWFHLSPAGENAASQDSPADEARPAVSRSVCHTESGQAQPSGHGSGKARGAHKKCPHSYRPRCFGRHTDTGYKTLSPRRLCCQDQGAGLGTQITSA